MVGLSVHESGGGGYLVLSWRVARATTTWAHASAPRWGETWVRSIKIPRFLAVLGGWAYTLRPPWKCQGDLGCGVLGLFSSIFLHIHKQKNWSRSRRSTVGVGPTPYKWLLPELDLHLSRERATLAPFARNSGVGHSSSWPPLHCGDLTNSHRRLFLAPHCTLRPSHLSVGGNARGLDIVVQLNM